MTTQQKRQGHVEFTHILVISAWGFAIVIASFIFLYLGYLLDQLFNTPPTFMLGLFFLAIVTCIWKLYQEAWIKRKDV
ncbi:MAG: AtpZ/AtpI family protein [Deltaproteobacteria bacterium]|nr:AtpZ/AtpI family protein [Deltaproteobacteria bacterium]